MRSSSLSISILTTGALLVAGGNAYAWGERGHHTVCEVATKLMAGADPASAEFARFMLSKGHMMGHVCNLPDISWRSLDVPDQTEGTILDPTMGNNCHFINPENFGYVRSDGSPDTIHVPLNYADVEKTADGFKKGKQTAHDVSGSNWWRTQQLYSLAITQGTVAVSHIESLIRLKAAYQVAFGEMSADEKAKLRAPLTDELGACKDRATCKGLISQATDSVNDSLRQMLIAMGIMGHFVGDAGQPYHNSANYNGQKNGHVGIHSFYETELVDQIPASLQSEVYAAAKADSQRNIDAILTTKDPDPKYSGDEYNVLARMRKLSDEAGQQMDTITNYDSDLIRIEDAIKNHKPLDQGNFTPDPKSKKAPFRPFASQVSSDSRFKPQWDALHAMIASEIGVSSKVLATFWGEILAKVDVKAQESAERLMTALGDAKLAEVDERTNRLDFTRFYTTYDYPLDSPYIEPSYLIGGLSLKSLPAGMQPPPPGPPRKTKFDIERGPDPDDEQ